MTGRIDTSHLRSMVPLSGVVGQVVQLTPAGNEMVGCCPFHADRTPSFYVSDDKGVFHCFGCGASGDVIDFVMKAEGVSFHDAVERLDAGTVRMRYQRQASAKPSRKGQEAAQRIWDAAGPLAGTPADRYLASRCVPLDRLPELPALRFTRLAYGGSVELHPVLVAAVRDVTGRLTGIQRTYLSEDGRKSRVGKPKLSLGSVRGGAIHIGNAAQELIVCEGLEDGLSLKLCMPEASVWVTAGAGMMAAMLLPDACRSVVIAADNDEAGTHAAEAAAVAFTRSGRSARIMRPSANFKDFNAELQGAHQ